MGEAIVRQELQSVVDAFQSYPTFEAEFAKGQGEADPVEEFKRRRQCESKVAQLMADFLYDILHRPESMTFVPIFVSLSISWQECVSQGRQQDPRQHNACHTNHVP